MTKPPPPEPERAPRVTVSSRDPELRARILAALEGTDLELTTPEEDDEGDATSDADLVILARDEFIERTETTDDVGEEGEGPGLLVISDRTDPTERARLVAAGARTVVDEGSPVGEFAASVEELARAEAEGTSQAATVRGSEDEPRLTDFRSSNARMQDFIEQVRRVIDIDSPLLVLGETGSGKERLARAIHAEGPRRDEPFITVNCGALPANLLESELFGHEEGAFTGASERRRGRFELAGRGTIFLDEIGEMPTELQVRLLDVLQRHEIQPLGAERTTPVAARVIAATHRDLAKDVSAGRFRSDLFYRLHVVPLRIPPLRERPEDIPELLGRFLRALRRSLDRPEVQSISRRALEKLLAHDWPGNVRELGNVLERAVLVAEGRQIRPADLDLAVRADGARGSRRRPARDARTVPESLDGRYKEVRADHLERFDREYFTRLLESCEGRVGRAAERAGIAERTLYTKLRRLGIDRDEFRRRR